LAADVAIADFDGAEAIEHACDAVRDFLAVG